MAVEIWNATVGEVAYAVWHTFFSYGMLSMYLVVGVLYQTQYQEDLLAWYKVRAARRLARKNRRVLDGRLIR